MNKYCLKIFGCQYNEWDGARLDFLFKKIGLITAPEKDADIIFILSCSVRKTAVDRVMSVAKNNKGKKVVITGCVLEDDRKKYLKKNVLLWDLNKPEELIEILNCHSEQSEESQKRDPSVALLPQDDKKIIVNDIEKIFSEGSPASSYLPIMIGCNNFCSYCAVPYVRGREKSRPVDEIVNDLKKMIQKGHKEITLLGQNVNSYNPDIISTGSSPANASVISTSRQERDEKSHSLQSKTLPFALLLKTLNDIPGDFQISFTSNHPKDMTDDIIAAVRDLTKVKKEIHLPLQSGSNKILKAMNRPYTKETYLELIDKIKQEIPGVRITTDTIIGFPGETEEDFQETVEVFEKVGYYQSFNNKYSPRAGTAAYKLGDPIPWSEKQRRWKILNDIANKK